MQTELTRRQMTILAIDHLMTESFNSDRFTKAEVVSFMPVFNQMSNALISPYDIDHLHDDARALNKINLVMDALKLDRYDSIESWETELHHLIDATIERTEVMAINDGEKTRYFVNLPDFMDPVEPF